MNLNIMMQDTCINQPGAVTRPPWSDIRLAKTQVAGMDGLYSGFLDNPSMKITPLESLHH